MVSCCLRDVKERAARESCDPRYQIRYRCTSNDGTTALIVVGEDAAPYLFSGGSFQARLRPHQRCERLVALLDRCGRWAPVPPVAPYTAAELRSLIDPGGRAAGRDRGRRSLARQPEPPTERRTMLRLPLRRERYA